MQLCIPESKFIIYSPCVYPRIDEIFQFQRHSVRRVAQHDDPVFWDSTFEQFLAIRQAPWIAVYDESKPPRLSLQICNARGGHDRDPWNDLEGEFVVTRYLSKQSREQDRLSGPLTNNGLPTGCE